MILQIALGILLALGILSMACFGLLVLCGLFSQGAIRRHYERKVK